MKLNKASRHSITIVTLKSRALFPALKTLESFDSSFQSSLPAATINELAELGFIEQAYNILFVGSAGTGKSHLSIALGLKACGQEKIKKGD